MTFLKIKSGFEPVVGDHDPVRDPEDPERLPAAVVVEDVLVGLVELADDVEDALGDLGNEGPHDGPVPEVQDVQAAPGRSVDAVTPVLGAVAAPLWNGPIFDDVIDLL